MIVAILFSLVSTNIKAQSLTTPQVDFSQRTSTASPLQTIYNVKGDFTMLGNTNLTLANYRDNYNNESRFMNYVDIDSDPTTLNSSMASLELSNSGENSASQNCSTVIYAGLYWTGKSNDNNESFSVTKNSVTKNYNKNSISLKGPSATIYTTITAKTNGANTDIRFPGSSQSGIFIGYQEVTDYVKSNGPGAYTVADIALVEGTNNNPGYSGGWVMIVVYENPVMKSRAVTLFDGYAYVNGQRSGGGEYGTIPISGFTTVGAGPVNMKLGVMAAEGDVATNSGSDYLAVQKLNANPAVYNTTNYLTLSHANNTTSNFFNSSIFPVPAAGKSNPILQNNTGVDFSMFTIPNTSNSVIGNNQTSTTFRFGSTYEVYTIFGFAMSVDSYIPEPKGLISVTSINNVPNPPVLNVSPGESINYNLDITNEGSEATNNTIISIPIPATAIFNPGGAITYNTYNGFTTPNTPYFDSATNKIIWNLGTLPVTPGHPEYVYADLSFNLDVTTDCDIILMAGCSPEVSLETGTIKGTGAISGLQFTKYFFQGYDESICHLPITGSIKVAINASSCLSSMAGPNQIASCGGESVTLGASTAKTGVWSIVSGPAGGGEIFSNVSSSTSEFYSPNIGEYTLRWTTNCETTDDVLVSFANCNILNFDGIDDNVTFKNNYSLNSGSFSIETWVKSNVTSGNKQTILSKRLGSSTANGYDLKLVNNIISFNWNNGKTIASKYPINTDRWYHVAVTYNGSAYKLYIDGISVQNAVNGVNPILNNANCILGAMDQTNGVPFNYFNGWMDELRIWKVELTVDQIRQMMNQEIQNNGGNVKGAIVPLDIPDLTWTNLDGYYQMNPTNDIVDGYVLGKSVSAINGKLRNIGTQQPDTAPLPYTSRVSGQDWSQDDTWTYYDVWDVPNSLAIDGVTRIDWNIVKTAHNISSTENKTVLGLLVNSNMISAVNDSKIEVSKYLKLDGKIDLVGKSQLIQTEGSLLEPNSGGSLERDQQGQSNKYNYNYWSSPVSPINTTANNTNYTVASVLRDGTNPASPAIIKWVAGYDGSPTSPISLARYWIYKFDNYANAYANWVRVGETGSVRVGQGFTLKGSGAAGTTQNYTFVGKPNNGTITANTVSSGQLLLAGNPYPSALDSKAFINDNLDSIDGSLYFWEHYTTNNTHVLRDYQGGYAVRNLTDGVPPVSPPLISGLGSSTKIPEQFIPVGQGFFLSGKSGSGGTITFKNSQRAFYKENEIEVSNTMFKFAHNIKKQKGGENNNSATSIKDTFKKLRLGFNSNNNYHRQVLIGFMNENATSGMDYGYDAYNFDTFPNDMYFLNGENKLVIQGEGFFDENAIYPIGVKADTPGNVKFMLDELENFDKNQNIFIYDNTDKSYHNIRNESFEVMIPKGENNNRFSLCFKDKKEKEVKENKKPKNLKMSHLQGKNVFLIDNSSQETSLKKVTLYNMNGQLIATWDIEDQSLQNIQLPLKNLSSGVYIAKIHTSSGELSKKIIIP
ncbi:LamG-like jellyroll fold domain-containing protein [Flavobacterium frigoris]|uniref:LamG-like jellyroll fold domain-containing protein n=1 Tax=Flavobacterium frigoris (strain PS1) TaxID=1086011 RepID=H7FWM3_FLAFP|nr:LamG-like jellyroll fold domain-containing protein [Flavobacterium frigoris]EIA07102.1 hypothetical protein HJ01_03567 [Flavobacterium frigoris PS1]